MKHRRREFILLVALFVIMAFVFYFFRPQKLSNYIYFDIEDSIVDVEIEVRQENMTNTYNIHDELILAEFNALFDHTEIRHAPLRFKLKPHSNDSTWIGWDFQLEDENGFQSFYLRSMDSEYFTLSINLKGRRSYRILSDMEEFRDQVEAIIQKGVD